MRAAKDHPFDGGIVQFGCKIVEIHRVIAVAADQRILNHPAAVARNFSGEGAIDRVLDDDAIPLVREDADQSAERRDNSGREKDFAGVNLPAEPPEKPAGDCGHAFRGFILGISKDSLVNPAVQCFENRVGTGKVHVCDPEAQHIIRRPLGKLKQFFGLGSAAVDDPVKIVAFHGLHLLRM